MGFIFIFIGRARGNLLILWKGCAWSRLNLREGLNFFNSTLILVVSIIVFHALILSRFYIFREKGIRGLLFITMLFVGAIIILIRRDSLLALFLGWDGLGVSSFFLVV